MAPSGDLPSETGVSAESETLVLQDRGRDEDDVECHLEIWPRATFGKFTSYASCVLPSNLDVCQILQSDWSGDETGHAQKRNKARTPTRKPAEHEAFSAGLQRPGARREIPGV